MYVFQPTSNSNPPRQLSGELSKTPSLLSFPAHLHCTASSPNLPSQLKKKLCVMAPDAHNRLAARNVMRWSVLTRPACSWIELVLWRLSSHVLESSPDSKNSTTTPKTRARFTVTNNENTAGYLHMLIFAALSHPRPTHESVVLSTATPSKQIQHTNKLLLSLPWSFPHT